MNEKIKERLKIIGGTILWALIIFGFGIITVFIQYVEYTFPISLLLNLDNDWIMVFMGSVVGQVLITMFYGFAKADFREAIMKTGKERKTDSEKYHDIRKIVGKFFKTKAMENAFTDYEECYLTLGYVKSVIEGEEVEQI